MYVFRCRTDPDVNAHVLVNKRGPPHPRLCIHLRSNRKGMENGPCRKILPVSSKCRCLFHVPKPAHVSKMFRVRGLRVYLSSGFQPCFVPTPSHVQSITAPPNPHPKDQSLIFPFAPTPPHTEYLHSKAKCYRVGGWNWMRVEAPGTPDHP